MISDEELKRSIARVTLSTSTSAEFCYNMPLEDYLDFYQTLSEESEQMRKEAEASGKQARAKGAHRSRR